MGEPSVRSLLPLSLEGKGTRDIEALPSYLLRLSACHGVTPGGLFRYLLSGYSGGEALCAALASQPFSASIRPNGTSERVIEILSHGQCEIEGELRRATFLYLTPALARSPKTYSRRLRWCPGCLYEQALTHGAAYFKLSWFLEGVQTCDIHRVVLRDSCPHCNRHPKPWSWWPLLSLCPYCYHPLDVVTTRDQIDLGTEASAPDLISLVEGIATRTSPFPAGSVNQYVNKTFEVAWSSARELDLWKKLSRDECLRYSSPDEPITLPIARRIAFRLEVPILELLDADHPTIQSFGFAAESPLPAPMRPGHRVKKIDRVVLTRNLKLILESPLQPLSLRRAARRLSVSVGAISYHCPNLASELVRRCTEFKKMGALRKQAEAKLIVQRALLNLVGAEKSATKKAILRDLYRETGLPKNLLMDEIRKQWVSSAI